MRNLLPLIWRGNIERYRLMGSKCENCGHEYFPQRSICPNCRRGGKIVPKEMPHEGKILSYTLVHSAPKGFELETPYHLAIIGLPNGVNILSQIVDTHSEKVKIGAKVKMVFRKIFEDDKEGAIAYGYKFTVVNGREGGAHEGPKKTALAHPAKPAKGKQK